MDGCETEFCGSVDGGGGVAGGAVSADHWPLPVPVFHPFRSCAYALVLLRARPDREARQL